MSAKELKTEQLIEYHESCLPELHFMIQWNEKDEYPPKEALEHQVKFIEATNKALSATIPRETAKCAPTEADCDKNGLVLGWNVDFEYYDACHWVTIGEQLATFPFWLPMPAAPAEVTKHD